MLRSIKHGGLPLTTRTRPNARRRPSPPRKMSLPDEQPNRRISFRRIATQCPLPREAKASGGPLPDHRRPTRHKCPMPSRVSDSDKLRLTTKEPSCPSLRWSIQDQWNRQGTRQRQVAHSMAKEYLAPDGLPQSPQWRRADATGEARLRRKTRHPHP